MADIKKFVRGEVNWLKDAIVENGKCRCGDLGNSIRSPSYPFPYPYPMYTAYRTPLAGPPTLQKAHPWVGPHLSRPGWDYERERREFALAREVDDRGKGEEEEEEERKGKGKEEVEEREAKVEDAVEGDEAEI